MVNSRFTNNYLIEKKISDIFYFLFYLLILIAPLIVYGISLGGFSLRFSRFLIILITPILLLKIILRPTLILRDNFYIISVLPYLLYTTLSIIWSKNVETGTGIERLGGLYEIVLLYTIIIVADLNVIRFEKFITYYTLSAVIPIGISFWQLANNIYNFSSSEVPFDFFLIVGKYDLLEGRVFVAGDGFSRVSSTFAEPTIFGNFMCSVLLFSFLLKYNNKIILLLLRIFQFFAFIILILSLTKLAILCFIVGMVFISRKEKIFRISLIFFLFLSFVIVNIISYYDMLFIFDRLFENTGHVEKLEESLAMMKDGNLIFGEGIGSIPFGSFHRFVLSRVYESGIIGLLFVLSVSYIPFAIFFQKKANKKSEETKNICLGVIVAVILGLHLYDFFIHLFPWIVIGAIMSFYNSEKESILLKNV